MERSGVNEARCKKEDKHDSEILCFELRGWLEAFTGRSGRWGPAAGITVVTVLAKAGQRLPVIS